MQATTTQQKSKVFIFSEELLSARGPSSQTLDIPRPPVMKKMKIKFTRKGGLEKPPLQDHSEHAEISSIKNESGHNSCVEDDLKLICESENKENRDLNVYAPCALSGTKKHILMPLPLPLPPHKPKSRKQEEVHKRF